VPASKELAPDLDKIISEVSRYYKVRPAKVVKDGNRDKVKYSIHDARTPAMFYLLQFIDKARSRPRPWHHESIWPERFTI
jgi:hypothetical protein